MASKCSASEKKPDDQAQLDLFPDYFDEARSAALAAFDAAVINRTGLPFTEWVNARVKAKRSLRQMADEFGILHGTLWRWIRRRMPGIKLKEESDLPSEEEYRQILQVWREEEVSSSQEIADRVGVSLGKVKAARRRYHKRSKREMKTMLSRRLTPSSETRRKRWHR